MVRGRDEQFLYVVGRFKSLLISADGEKYSPEGFEDSLTDSSKFIDQVVLHNNQDPYTTVIIVPNKEALKEYVKSGNPGIDLASREAKELMLKKIQEEVNSYRRGGSREGMFPERWLPAAIVVADEPFTEQNHMVNLIRRFSPKAIYANFIIELAECDGMSAMPSDIETTALLKL